MSGNLVTRAVVIVAVVALAAFLATPPEEKINLGLDLQGGMHLVLQVQTDDAVGAERDADMERLKSLLEDDGVAGVATVAGTAGDSDDISSFRLTGVPAGSADAVEEIHERYMSDRWLLSETDGGFVLTMNERAKRETRQQTVDQAIRNIRNRVDEFGVAEPQISRQGFTDSERVVVQLPGVDDPERVKKLIKQTAFLEFRLSDFPPGGSNGVDSAAEVLQHYGGTLPDHVELLQGEAKDPQTSGAGPRYFAIEKRAAVTGRDLRNARVSAGQFGEPVVAFTLSADKGDVFAEFTEQNKGRGLAIVIDDHVISAPGIRGRIATDGQIEGNFTQQEALDLVTALKSGALPASIITLEERNVGPSLGQDSIDQGLRAGLIGAGLVVLTMLVVYLLSGVNAVVVLSLNMVLVFGFLAGAGATLTLPGIAGIILTIGMAVDANVLIFERIREELRSGRTVKSAVESGFGKALSSILDANITTLIAALFLFQFGTGPIRGFAVTLSVGILASVFTAVFVSRWLFDLWLSRRQRLERLSI